MIFKGVILCFIVHGFAVGFMYIHIKWLIEISPNQKANMPVNTETVETIKNNIQIHIN